MYKYFTFLTYFVVVCKGENFHSMQKHILRDILKRKIIILVLHTFGKMDVQSTAEKEAWYLQTNNINKKILKEANSQMC